MRMVVAAAVAGALLLPGCLTPEGRFDSGFSDVHVQVSPVWRDPGLYDALPDNGTMAESAVRTVFVPPLPPHNAVPDYPMRIPFDDPGVAATYGPSILALVCWRTGGPSPTERLEFCLQPSLLVQAMVGWNVTEEEKRAPFRTFVTMLVNVSEHRLGAAAAQFAHYDGGTGGGDSYPLLSTLSSSDAGYHEAGLGKWDVHVSEAFRDLGGIDAFTAVRGPPAPDYMPDIHGREMRLALGLCEPCRSSGPIDSGYVDLVQGNWTFSLRTPLRVVEEGPFADHIALVVTPDDSVEAVHFDSGRLSDRQAKRALRDAMERLDREAPNMEGWEFLHGTIEMSEGEASVDWDHWDECPPRHPPAPGCPRLLPSG